MAATEPAILTIGYGHREIAAFIDLLHEHDVQFLGDVRSRPNSRFNPDFSADRLKTHLEHAGITYVFLGDTLGGDPGTLDVRTSTTSGDEAAYIVDYSKLREQPFFERGMQRLRKAWATDSRLVLMCSEARPEQCHRARLIGTALEDEQIPVLHIDENGDVQTQQQIMIRVDKGQSTLPGFGPSPKATRSSRSWKPKNTD